MKYLVIEIQTTEDNTSNIVTVCDSEAVANQTYHTILSYASVSSVLKHSAVMLTDAGEFVKAETYFHDK